MRERIIRTETRVLEFEKGDVIRAREDGPFHTKGRLYQVMSEPVRGEVSIENDRGFPSSWTQETAQEAFAFVGSFAKRHKGGRS